MGTSRTGNRLRRCSSGAVLCLTLLLSACVSIDSRIQSEAVDKLATQNLSGRFANKASYWSGKHPASEKMSDMLDVNAGLETVVTIAYKAGGPLEMKWFAGQTEEKSRTFPPEELHIAADGAIEIRKERSVENVGNFAEVQTWRIRVFVTTKGELAVVKTFREAGVGFLVIVPVALASHSEQMAIFPRRD